MSLCHWGCVSLVSLCPWQSDANHHSVDVSLSTTERHKSSQCACQTSSSLALVGVRACLCVGVSLSHYHCVDCLPLYSSVFLCIPLYSSVFLCIPLYSSVFLYIPLYSSALCIPMYSSIFLLIVFLVLQGAIRRRSFSMFHFFFSLPLDKGRNAGRQPPPNLMPLLARPLGAVPGHWLYHL